MICTLPSSSDLSLSQVSVPERDSNVKEAEEFAVDADIADENRNQTNGTVPGNEDSQQHFISQNYEQVI